MTLHGTADSEGHREAYDCVVSTSPFIVVVSDLLGRTGARRAEHIEGPLEVALDQVVSCSDATATVTLEAVADGLVVRGSVAAECVVRCNRCLKDIQHAAEAPITQAYGLPSEDDILGIEDDGTIDLEPLLHDELSLAIPLVPLCAEKCLGLCPECGTDLNTEPCDGHPGDSTSPFAVLQGMFDPQSEDPERT